MDQSDDGAMEIEATGRNENSSHDEEVELDRRLDAAEEAVCKIMQTTKNTLDELQNIPNCNMEKLTSLAGEFVGKISYRAVCLTLILSVSVCTRILLIDNSPFFTHAMVVCAFS